MNQPQQEQKNLRASERELFMLMQAIQMEGKKAQCSRNYQWWNGDISSLGGQYRGSHKDQVCVLPIPLPAIEIQSLQVYQTQECPELCLMLCSAGENDIRWRIFTFGKSL